MRRTFHVFKLAAFDRPKKYVGNDRDEYQAERDEEVEDVHGVRGRREVERGGTFGLLPSSGAPW